MLSLHGQRMFSTCMVRGYFQPAWLCHTTTSEGWPKLITKVTAVTGVVVVHAICDINQTCVICMCVWYVCVCDMYVCVIYMYTTIKGVWCQIAWWCSVVPNNSDIPVSSDTHGTTIPTCLLVSQYVSSFSLLSAMRSSTSCFFHVDNATCTP